MQTSYQAHDHRSIVHNHEHIHITHHAKGGAGGEIEHLAAVHDHEHNHPALDHSHFPHRDPEREHAHEGHIHDHSHPGRS